MCSGSAAPSRWPQRPGARTASALALHPVDSPWRLLGQDAASTGAHGEKASGTGDCAIGHLGRSSAFSAKYRHDYRQSPRTSPGLSSLIGSEFLTGESMSWLQGSLKSLMFANILCEGACVRFLRERTYSLGKNHVFIRCS